MKRKGLRPKKVQRSVNKRTALETGALAALELSRRPASPKFSITFPIPVYDEEEHVIRPVQPDPQRCYAGGKTFDRMAGESLADFQMRVSQAIPRGEFLLMEPVFPTGYMPKIEVHPFPGHVPSELERRFCTRIDAQGNPVPWDEPVKNPN